MRILVTGANGQVGHALLRALVPAGGLAGPTAATNPAFAGGPEGPTAATNPAYAGGPEGPTGSGSRLPPLLQKADGTPQRIVLAPPCEIIPATRNGECSAPLPPGEGAPQGRVRVRACEVIDLADLDGVRHALDRIAPDLIINTAAYTAVDRAEDEAELAQRVNADAVDVLGAWAAQHAARVIHYSTDYVFDGTASKPYREDDLTQPHSVYGRSKLAGEIALRDSGARHLIFRTAWVYAARGHNFLRTMLRLGADRDELRVVDDQIGAPTPARLIADVTALAIARWCAADADQSARIDGTWHLVAAGETSWCGFARVIFDRAVQAGLLAHAPRVTAITTADYPTRATRPAYSVLDTTKLRTTFDVRLPDWQTALDDVIREFAV